MKGLQVFFLVALAIIAIAAAQAEDAESDTDRNSVEDFNSHEHGDEYEQYEPDYEQDFAQTSDNGNILLMEWVPHPIDQYKFAVVNVSDRYVVEQGQLPLERFSEDEFPDVSVIFTPVKGDAEYIFTNIKAPVLSIESFRDDYFFEEYQDIIYKMHGFQSKVELWAHFLTNLEAFSPVQDKLSDAFQNYLNTLDAKQSRYPQSDSDDEYEFPNPEEGNQEEEQKYPEEEDNELPQELEQAE